MNTFHFSDRGASNARREQGLTLIELMVAMLLGLIVIAGVASVFLANMRSYRTNTALGDVQSNSRIAFELMARDIRQAGLTGCNSANGRVANVVNDQATHWWANWNNAVHGYAQDQDDPAVASGAGNGERVADTDSLMLIGAIGSGVSVAEDNEPASNFKLNETSSNLETGDIIIVCDPDHATIVQITDYNNNNVTLVHNTGNTKPGNCSKGLAYPTDCSSTNGNTYHFDRNSRIAELAAHDWYIGNNPAGGRSLYRVAADANGGAITTQAQEMVRNVTNMQVEYHQLPNKDFVDAGAVTQWAKVDAVRLVLTVQSTTQRSGTDAAPISRSFTTTTTVRNRVN